MHVVTIHRFPGDRPIEKLPICPDKFIKEELIQQRDLVNRGKKYIDLLRKTFAQCQYDGTISVSDADPYESQTHRRVRFLPLHSSDYLFTTTTQFVQEAYVFPFTS